MVTRDQVTGSPCDRRDSDLAEVLPAPIHEPERRHAPRLPLVAVPKTAGRDVLSRGLVSRLQGTIDPGTRNAIWGVRAWRLALTPSVTRERRRRNCRAPLPSRPQSRVDELLRDELLAAHLDLGAEVGRELLGMNPRVVGEQLEPRRFRPGERRRDAQASLADVIRQGGKATPMGRRLPRWAASGARRPAPERTERSLGYA